MSRKTRKEVLIQRNKEQKMDIVKAILWSILLVIVAVGTVVVSIVIVVVITILSAAIPAGITWFVSWLAGWGWDFLTLLAIWTIVMLGVALIGRS